MQRLFVALKVRSPWVNRVINQGMPRVVGLKEFGFIERRYSNFVTNDLTIDSVNTGTLGVLPDWSCSDGALKIAVTCSRIILPGSAFYWNQAYDLFKHLSALLCDLDSIQLVLEPSKNYARPS